MDAVGGCAADIIEAVFRAADFERSVQSERVADTAAVTFGGNDAHVGKFAGNAGEQGDALGKVAVVVGNQDVHVFSLLVQMRFGAFGGGAGGVSADDVAPGVAGDVALLDLPLALGNAVQCVCGFQAA